jgi:hypothetical protein
MKQKESTSYQYGYQVGYNIGQHMPALCGDCQRTIAATAAATHYATDENRAQFVAGWLSGFNIGAHRVSIVESGSNGGRQN